MNQQNLIAHTSCARLTLWVPKRMWGKIISSASICNTKLLVHLSRLEDGSRKVGDNRYKWYSWLLQVKRSLVVLQLLNICVKEMSTLRIKVRYCTNKDVHNKHIAFVCKQMQTIRGVPLQMNPMLQHTGTSATSHTSDLHLCNAHFRPEQSFFRA